MRIFNLRFICRDKTPVEGVWELNTYSLGDAADVGIVGSVYGVEFFLTIEEGTFHFVQCEDEALIYFVPENANGFEDYELLFSHNTYEDMFDILETKVGFDMSYMLKNLWLYTVDGNQRFNTRKCLGVN